MSKDAIAFIGAGSAMVVPPLLQDGLDCFVVNDEARLGGHIHTKTLELTEIRIEGNPKPTFSHLLRDWEPADIERFLAKPKEEHTKSGDEKNETRLTYYIPIESGTEFIGAPENYPIVHAEFKRLDIKLEFYTLDIDIYNTETKIHTFLPGIAQQIAEKANECCSFFSSKKPKTPPITQESVLKQILELIELQKVAYMADRVDEGQREVETVAKLYEDVSKTLVPGIQATGELKIILEDLVKHILYPLVIASYGQPRDVVKTFCANDANNYLAIGKNGWYRAITGLSTYIHRLKEECTKTHFVPPQKATKLEKIMDGLTPYYKIQLEDGTYVVDPETKEAKLFKYVMISTNAKIMTDLLSTIDDSELKELVEALKKVAYYNSTLQFHTDQTFVASHGAKVFIPYDPIADTATLNRSRPDLYPAGAPLVVNSWEMRGQKEVPNGKTVFNDQTTCFVHPYVDNNFRHAQQVIERFQGKHGLFFGGIVAGFNDSHESAMQANLRVAWMISAIANFTKDQKYKLEHSAMPVFQPEFKAAQLGVGKVTTCCCC